MYDRDGDIRRLRALRRELAEANRQLTRRPAIIVTDHALLRWFERVERIDIAALRDEIARAASVGVAHGAGSVVIGGGKLVIKGGAVVTVLPRNAHRADLIGVIEAVIDGDILPTRKPRRRRR